MSSIKPVHMTRTVYRWLQRHQDISEQWILSVVTWTEHPLERDDYTMLKYTKVGGRIKKVTLWIRNYSWRYLVYKIHMENV